MMLKRTLRSDFPIVLIINFLSSEKKKKLPLFPPSFDSILLLPQLVLNIYSRFFSGAKELIISAFEILSKFLIYSNISCS